MEGHQMNECCAFREGDTLVLENNRIARRYAWNNGHLISQQIVDKLAGQTWALTGSAPDCSFPGEATAGTDGALRVTDCPATAFRPAHLQADVTTRLGGLEILRRFRIYPDCPAIACDFYLRGQPVGTWGAAGAAETGLANVESIAALYQGGVQAVVLDRLRLPQKHLRLECVQFFDVTDRRNTLVTSRAVLPYRFETPLPGNLLLIQDALADRGLFILKEAPCSDAQLAWPGCDFIAKIGEIQAVGVGLTPADLDPDAWTRGYGCAVGVADGGEFGLLSALRSYQAQIRIHQPGRDEMILLNTWGDRGQDTRIRESFALAELEAAARLGVTHFQLDDGWQSGHSSNSATAGGSLENIWARGDYWTPHPERFPNGLGPVVERSKALGIELCLWFNPSRDDSNAHWRDDADALIGLYRQYGIRTFKIDGTMIPDKRADLHLRAMFERVMDATGGQAVFNLDVTAGRRWGYHYGNEYGNIFLENRYTDWGNYHPHWTLRNLWMLSRTVPPQNLQIEFLNKWRNTGRYDADDPLAPGRVPFDYCFAITMMAQPLAWFEATGLPEEAFASAPLIRTYRQHQARIHAGQIFPIGAEPSGAGWTGFQSIGSDGGYLLIFRERNDRPEAPLRLWNLAGQTIHCTLIAGHGRDFSTRVDAGGAATFALDRPLSFALYAYRV
jgi:hypothetical protein